MTSRRNVGRRARCRRRCGGEHRKRYAPVALLNEARELLAEVTESGVAAATRAKAGL